MPKSNTKGGKKHKRGKGNMENQKRELEFKDEGQEYGVVLKLLGNCRCQVSCLDGRERLCSIRGKLRKKVYINAGDIVLVSLRDFQDDKADIILKYSAEEARNLKTYKELPDNLRINETGGGDSDEESVEGVMFMDTEGVDVDAL